jgi:hypothetical protein
MDASYSDQATNSTRLSTNHALQINTASKHRRLWSFLFSTFESNENLSSSSQNSTMSNVEMDGWMNG